MKIFLLLFILLGSAQFAFADHSKEHRFLARDHAELSEIELAPNTAVVEINGVVCSFCAYGMQKGIAKLSFINQEGDTKGVLADIEKQQVRIALKKGEPVDVDKLFNAIRDGGYEPIRILILNDDDKVSVFDWRNKE